MGYSERKRAFDVAIFTQIKRGLAMQDSGIRKYIKLAVSIATGKRHSFRLERMIAKLPRHANSTSRIGLNYTQDDLILDIKRRIK